MPRINAIAQSLLAKTENTITIQWSADAIADYLWYSSDNGITWIDLDIPDSASGTYTISALSAGESYDIKTRIRYKQSQSVVESEALQVTTYTYPSAISTPDFVIGETVRIGLYNPLNRAVSVKLLSNQQTECVEISTTGEEVLIESSDTMKDLLYRSIPADKESNYFVSVSFEAHTEIQQGGLYKVNNSDCHPLIETLSYRDTNQEIIELTGNDQDIVQSKSIVRYTAAGLSAQLYASIVSCSVTVNESTYGLALSGSSATGGDSTINSARNVEAVFTVTDSRGITHSKSLNINILAWYNPTAIIRAQREDNCKALTEVYVDTSYASINGNNSVSITYTATAGAETGMVTPNPITGTLTDKEASTITLDLDFAWCLDISIVDLLGGTVSYKVPIPRGLPILFIDRDLSSVGINCFPRDRRSLEVNGINISPEGGSIRAGLFFWWTGSPADMPSGFLVCNGQAVSRVNYANLFNAIGTRYGAGDGSTTFNLPNLATGNGRFVRAGFSDSEIGTLQDDKIRNIIGHLDNGTNGNALTGGNAGGYNVTGALKITLGRKSYLEYGGNENNRMIAIDIDANNGNSSSNPMAGHADGEDNHPYDIIFLPLIAF